MNKQIRIFILTLSISSISQSVFAAKKTKQDNPISLAILGGLNMTQNPASPSYTAKYFYANTRKPGFFPFGGIYSEVRFYKIFGLSLNTMYINRNFSFRNDHDLSSISFANHCIDLGLFFSIYPSSFHGLMFYMGPKISFILNNNSSSVAYDRKKTDLDEEKKINLKKFNWGILIGTKAEIDRTGFFFGGEVDYFFNSIRIEKEIPTEIKQNTSKVESWKDQENRDKMYFLSFRIYIGYDFLRKYFSDYNF